MTEITGLLTAWSEDEQHEDRLLSLVYDDLRRIACHHLRRERIDHSWPPAALVHETFFRLRQQDRIHWQGRRHFFGVASRIMRRLLIDYARRRVRAQRLAQDMADEVTVEDRSQNSSLELLALDQALRALATAHPQHAQIVELRFFGGLTRQETADLLGLSVPTVTRRWRTARAWLYRRLQATEDRAAR